MSLVKRLWMVVVLVALAVVGTATVINLLYAKRYLENEIKVKNIDTATALALTISHSATDLVTVKLLVSSQFDLGHYKSVDYVGPDGRLLVHREMEFGRSPVPAWFTRLVLIEPPAGVAEIQNGWKQLGAIHVQSDPSFAYDALWSSAAALLEIFLTGGVLVGILGTLFIRSVIRPLNRVVDQAEALAERRYIEIAPPSTREFRLIVEAMNRFAQKIKNLFDDESARLKRLQQDYEIDKLTGFMVRDVFLRNAAAEIEQEDTHEHGLILLVHVGNLEELNREIGRVQADKLFQSLAAELKQAFQSYPGTLFGRLNSTDLCVLVPDQINGAGLLQALGKRFQAIEEVKLVALNYGFAQYGPRSSMAELLSACDQSLKPAREQDGVIDQPTSPEAATTASQWNRILDQALQNHEFKLALYPVRGRNQAYLHTEAPARLVSSLTGESLVAGAFLPWARRRGLGGQVDLAIISQAFEMLAAHEHDLAINLGFESVCDIRQVKQIAELMESNQALAARICLDIPEAIAFGHSGEFYRFCERLNPTGCRIGVEHLNHQMGHLSQFHSLGLHYIKVSRSLVKDCAQDQTVKTMLRGLCTIAHTMGLQVIAEGVTMTEAVDLLFELGFDGVTGPAIH